VRGSFPSGVRLRATIGATLAFGVVLAAGAWFLVDRQRANLTSTVETSARLRVADIAAALDAGELPARVTVPEEDRAFVQIIDGSGAVVRQSSNIEGEPRLVAFPVPAEGDRARTLTVEAVDDSPFRVVGRRVDAPRAELTVYVGASLEPVAESSQALERTLATVAPLLLLAVGGLTWIVVGRALHPVDAIRDEVERIGDRELFRRVPEPKTDDEIARLARTMNRMLERLEDAVRRQRRFVADASHELRSPLTGMRALLEVDLTHPEGADWQGTERDVLAETLRLHRLVDDLLVLARSDAGPEAVPRLVTDLDDLVLKEVRRLRVRGKVRADAHGVTAAPVLVDPDALTRVIRNLLDNAERHARSQVILSVRETAEAVELVVSDDGPGVPVELRDRVFERFGRADDDRSRTSGGAGLGLAIAREIVEAHGGTLTLDGTGPGGGAAFVVRLPLVNTIR
jgi:signal transduction histidine kinase